MDFKKYLIVLIFFVVGVLVGKNMPQQDSAANSASSLRSGVVNQDTTNVVNTPTVTSPTRTPVTNTTITNNQVQSDSSTVKPVTTTIYPVVDNTNIELNTTTQYAGIGFLTKNSYKGNILNDIEEVKNLQKFLIAQNILIGSADGKFGPMTQNAVINFQNLFGIKPGVGYVGPVTRQYINNIIGGDPLGRQKPKCNCKNINGTPGMQQPGGACQASDNCLWNF